MNNTIKSLATELAKPGAKSSLLFVVSTTATAILFSWLGNLQAAMPWLLVALAAVALHSQSATTSRAIELAEECNAGWKNSIEERQRLINLLFPLEKKAPHPSPRPETPNPGLNPNP